MSRSTQAKKQTAAAPIGFRPVEWVRPLRAKDTPRTVQAYKIKGDRQARVRFGPGTLGQAKLGPDSLVSLALLENGMWAVVPDANGFKITRANKDATAHMTRFTVQCRFANEAELLHRMWVFPASTFALVPPTDAPGDAE